MDRALFDAAIAKVGRNTLAAICAQEFPTTEPDLAKFKRGALKGLGQNLSCPTAEATRRIMESDNEYEKYYAMDMWAARCVLLAAGFDVFPDELMCCPLQSKC